MWASSPTKCLPIGFRRAAYPHAAVMVRWLSGGGLRAARPLGKGALGTGVRIATTSDIGHWFRNDMGFCKRCSFVRRKYHDSI